MLSKQIKITVLGGGRVGSAFARDLAKDEAHDVTVHDFDEKICSRIEKFGSMSAVKTDLTKHENDVNAVADSDIVVGAVW